MVKDLTLYQKLLCSTYVLIAIVSVILCWSEAFQYLEFGFFGAWKAFFTDVNVNHGSRFLNYDASSVCITFAIWSIVDGKRKNIKYAFLYPIMGVLVAISFAFPLYLIHRELKINN